MDSLTIVTSCSGYGRYLEEWADSVAKLRIRPGAVCVFTHGSEEDQRAGLAAVAKLDAAGIQAKFEWSAERLDFGTARNRAVAMSSSEWVMHLDADDQIMPHATEDFIRLAPGADVIAAGYERTGDLKTGPSLRRRLYSSTVGEEALRVVAPCSGVSPFRRSFWERKPYRTDMLGAWDTALWIGFARMGARFEATKRPVFWYRQHADSVFNRRRKVFDWTHFLTVAQLKGLRAGHHGVGVIVPRDVDEPADRAAAWAAVRRHYETNHSSWEIVEGRAPADGWIKGAAIADALTRSSAAVLVIADADCLIPPAALNESVEAVASRQAPWAVPHGRVLRLSPTQTAEWLARSDGKPGSFPPYPAEIPAGGLAREPYRGFAGGGVFVVPRAHYEAAGGIPRAFRGWGSEDQAIGVILDCLVGAHVRGSADLVHLWHEPQRTKGTHTGNHSRYAAIASAARRGPEDLFKVLRQLDADSQLAVARAQQRQTAADRARGGSRGYLGRGVNQGTQ